MIDKAFRNPVIGSALTEQVLTFAKENGATKVWLATLPFMTEAIAQYKKFGFEKCGYLLQHYWVLDVDLYELVFR